MAKADFFYSILHDSTGIDKHIQRFAPSNRFNRLEFEKTTKAERVALFHGVVEAIHNAGKGLNELSYTQKSTKKEIKLFTDAEVIHLKDVAILLDKMKPLSVLAMMFWLLLVVWIMLKRIKLPSAKKFVSLGVILLVAIGLVLSLGPEKVFNQLHIWAFPDNHQWFFYYEDSLMSTMMMAPYLFAYISTIWLLLSTLLTVLILRLLHLFQASKR